MRRSLLLWVVLFATACEGEQRGAYVHRISSPEELIGGPSALGAVGDWKLGNQRIEVIIQDQGWSRGFGIFGGGIIDADLVRAQSRGTRAGGEALDNFGELFPALFLQAFDVGDQKVRENGTGGWRELPGIEIIADGSDGGPAILRTRASGGDFLTLVEELLGAAIPQRGLLYETDYILHPAARHVEIVGRIKNGSSRPIELPDAGLAALLEDFGIHNLQVPLGDVVLFGAGNSVFSPGAVQLWEDGAPSGAKPRPVGFDIRFSVEDTYRIPRSLPALPGLVVDFMATAGGDVSYGFAVADSERNYVWLNRDQYRKDSAAPISKHAMLIPFLIDAFTGAYYEVPPETLAPAGQPGDTHEYRRYFIVGTGDVASIRDELFRLRGQSNARLEGRVVDRKSGAPVSDASVHILDAEGMPYSQAAVDDDGRFVCRIEPGRYQYVVTAPGRYPFPPSADRETTRFEVSGARDADLYIEIPSPAHLDVQIRDDSGRALPAKVSVVSTYESEYDGRDPQDFLFEFWLDERRRATDLSWRDPPGERERRFVEKVLVTHDGHARGLVRPSCDERERCRPYDIYISRGPEYEVEVIRDVMLEEGGRRQLDAVLSRVVDTENWLSADLHVHSAQSVDSSMLIEQRVRAAAAEGLEMLVATDHNFVTDYRPTIAAMGLQDWMTSVIGVELSTLEMGHFNGFPLRYDVGVPSHFPFVEACNPAAAHKANGTAFDWVECPPQKLFDNLRSLGRYGPEETVVQINHPRDTILGYFNQYYMNPYTAEPSTPSGDNYPEAAFFIWPHDRTPEQFAPSSFSWDFDAIEVLNGKRLDLLHAFRVAEDAPAERMEPLVDLCEGGHQLNAPGEVRLRSGGHIAYPGAVDDWLNMLNDGRRFTATGASDSHKLSAEVGTPRTYFWVPPQQGERRDDLPARVEDLDLVHALKSQRAIVSNGPFIDMYVVTDSARDGERITWGIGDTVNYARSNAGREVQVLLVLRAPFWMDVDQIIVRANGEEVDQVRVGERDKVELLYTRTYAFDVDTVLVAEVTGDESMFPMVTPKEQPPTNITDALGGITAGMGLESSFGAGDNVIAPDYVQKVTPYALTNPIWLDIDASGTWEAPGNAPGPGPAADPPDGSCEQKRRTVIAERRAAEILLAPAPAGSHFSQTDVRKLFQSLGKR